MNGFEPAHNGTRMHYQLRHEISNNVVCANSKALDAPLHKHKHSLIRAFASQTVKLLTDQYLEFLSIKGDCTCSSKSTPVKMPHCCGSFSAGGVDIQ